jgi:2-aminoadipate transaminase
MGSVKQAGRAPQAVRLLDLQLDRTAEAPPLYRQIRDGVEAEVLGGALGAGMRLPPERLMARTLKVNRSTVMAAYQELAASGVVEARPGKGTVVLKGEDSPNSTGDGATDLSWLLALPAFGRGNLGPDPGLLRDLATLSARPEIISLAAGAPGDDLLPSDALLQALEAGLSRLGPGVLGYAPVEGLPMLREVLAERLCSRGVRLRSDEVMVLSGATQGLALAAQALIEPGDTVAIEAPTYIGVLQTFAAAGARLLPIPVDEHGMRVDILASLITRAHPRLVVTQPVLHNPTNTTMSMERREKLLALARRYGVPILEDDAYGELWQDESGPPPLKAQDGGGSVIYLSTASKTVAPGLRMGWLAAHPAVIARMSLAKQFADMHSNGLAQVALHGFLTTGYDRHLARVRAAYTERRSALARALRSVPGLTPRPGSPGGFYLWCSLPTGVTGRQFAAAAARAGVGLVAGEAFYPPDGPGTAEGQSRVRLGCASHGPAKLEEAVARLAPLVADAAAQAKRPTTSPTPLV